MLVRGWLNYASSTTRVKRESNEDELENDGVQYAFLMRASQR